MKQRNLVAQYLRANPKRNAGRHKVKRVKDEEDFEFERIEREIAMKATREHVTCPKCDQSFWIHPTQPHNHVCETKEQQ